MVRAVSEIKSDGLVGTPSSKGRFVTTGARTIDVFVLVACWSGNLGHVPWFTKLDGSGGSFVRKHTPPEMIFHSPSVQTGFGNSDSDTERTGSSTVNYRSTMCDCVLSVIETRDCF